MSRHPESSRNRSQNWLHSPKVESSMKTLLKRISSISWISLLTIKRLWSKSMKPFSRIELVITGLLLVSGSVEWLALAMTRWVVLRADMGMSVELTAQHKLLPKPIWAHITPHLIRAELSLLRSVRTPQAAWWALIWHWIKTCRITLEVTEVACITNQRMLSKPKVLWSPAVVSETTVSKLRFPIPMPTLAA